MSIAPHNDQVARDGLEDRGLADPVGDQTEEMRTASAVPGASTPGGSRRPQFAYKAKGSAMVQPACASWCTEDDGHASYPLREDQSCWGPGHRVVFSLADHAPGSTIPVPDDATGMTVYAYRGYYELPKVKLNVCETDEIDRDYLLTPQEAIELASHLIGVANLIAGAR
ncbi:Uncharacterised protein [Mycobacteroides abscessus subsp. abscessus]|nr:Uncharacterised protein [Mycobacteroides abscessus subsp. abscessus]SIA74164.1 Uncharacterised protein [Mycobacteroides abscessus subsp. abscessus]SIE26389.1 Uncharacterised protein [Mycobacteroides abscessus subsp. abscessus]SIE40719.1 Uncharacterised protein [Mycobacteroides abscessus subsp. abscessus]SIH97655.1 Uncharacterised protein [Mycobacteroides abscessus subsp. abscessus]